MKKRDKKIMIVYIVSFLVLAISFSLDKLVNDAMPKLQQLLPESFMSIFTHFGNGLIVALLGIMTLVMWFQKKREWIPTLWAAFLSAIVIASLIKLGVGRPRPVGVEFLPFINIVSYSFPSLHTTVIVTIATVLEKEYPGIKWFWLIIIAIIAFDRLYSQVHYLSDVAAGAILGFSIGLIYIRLEEKKGLFKRWIFSR